MERRRRPPERRPAKGRSVSAQSVPRIDHPTNTHPLCRRGERTIEPLGDGITRRNDAMIDRHIPLRYESEMNRQNFRLFSPRQQSLCQSSRFTILPILTAPLCLSVVTRSVSFEVALFVFLVADTYRIIGRQKPEAPARDGNKVDAIPSLAYASGYERDHCATSELTLRVTIS